MAGTESTSEYAGYTTETEIQNLKTEFSQFTIKVIENLGSIPYMISVSMPEFGMCVKFQLDGDYPTSAPCVICKPLVEDTAHLSGSLASHLENITHKCCKGTVLTKLLTAAKDWLEKEDIDISKDRAQDNSPKRKKNQKKKNKTKTQEEEVYDEKKPPMKTAIDVISRIQWDEAVQAECITIGYMDRMLGLLEKQFSAFSWEDIASVDYNVLAIPKHRIQYFKYKDVKVWDKNERLDNVFGSLGGKTIQAVIEEYERQHTGERGRAHQYEYVTDSSGEDDDDNFVIKTGCEPTAASTDAGAAEALYPREAYWGRKARPTHFLALRLTDPELVSNTADALKVIEEMEPSYKMCMIPPERLHITLCCLGLDTEDHVQKASNTLHKIRGELERFNPKDIEVSLKGTGDFFRSVLYGKVEENVQFLDFVQQLRMCIQHEGLDIRDAFEFNPHMTLLKMKQQHKTELRSNFLDIDRISKPFEDKAWGSQHIESIYLCSMSEDKQADGFYLSPAKITFM